MKFMKPTHFRYLLSGVASALALLILAGPAISLNKPKQEFIDKVTEAMPAEAPAKPAKARKILVFSKTNGFRHSSIETGHEALRLMGEKTGAFTSVHSEDEAMFEPETLKQFDAVIMLNTTGDIFRPKDWPSDETEKKAAQEREERLKKSLVDFVKSGKGLAGMHAATDTYANWKEYNEMMGGAFAGHPWHEKVRIKNLAAGNVLTKSFPDDGFDITDEIYQFREDTASPKERRMLLALDGAGTNLEKGKYGKDGLYPVSWARKYGEGRTFYCSLGHREEIYWNTDVLKHYLAGIQFVLGDLKADVTPKG